uniref:proteasome endopeptidase complex n=1 Tax=Attheya septentrionalis TaxID=420275 RepID=A0A7S2UIY2_9STRA
MGTTLVAVRYRLSDGSDESGVVMGADTRTSVSGYVSNRFAAKLTPILLGGDDETNVGSTCVVGRAGSAADTQFLADALHLELSSRRRLVQKIPGTVTATAHLLRTMQRTGFEASILCAGWDHVLQKALIYQLDKGGTLMECDEISGMAVAGSGSTYIRGLLDSTSPPTSQQEAMALVTKCLHLAMQRDGSSGGWIRLVTMDSKGQKKHLIKSTHDMNKLLNKKVEPQDSKQEYTDLKGFAPPKPVRSSSSPRSFSGGI